MCPALRDSLPAEPQGKPISTPQSSMSNFAFLVVQMIKNLPAMQDTWVLSLVQEDSLEKRMATHSNILAGL